MDITLSGTLRNDQTISTQDDDDAIGGNLSGLITRFANFLNGTGLGPSDPTIPPSLALVAAQLAYADDVEGVVTCNLGVTVNPQGSTVDDLFFSAPDGSLLNGDQVFISPGVPLQTLGGSSIFLHSYDNGNIVLATTSATEGAGSVVAAFYLDEAVNHLSASIQTVTFTALKHPNATNPDDSINWTDLLNVSASGSLSFDFDQLRSGSSLWCAVGNATGGVLITGGNPLVDAANKKTNVSDVIHTSQGGTGATIGVNNQLFDNSGETAVFTLVTGLASLGTAPDAGAVGDYTVDPLPNKKPIEGIDYGGYINTNGAGIFLSQSQGNLAKNLDIKLWEAGGDVGSQTAEDLTSYIPGLGSDTSVTVASVTITDDDGDVVGIWGAGGTLNSGDTVNGNVSANGVANVQVSFSGNTIDVNGVLGEYTVSWTSATGQTFNRFSVIAQGGQFDIGRVDVDNVTGDTQAVGGSMFVDDDGPAIGDSAGGSAIANSTVHLTTGATSGNVGLGDLPGTDGQNSLQITSFTATASLGAGVTLEGVINAAKTEVKYFQDLNNNDILDGNDVHWYTMSITQNATSADFYNFTVVNAPAAPPLIFNFDNLPSGANLFGSVAASADGAGIFVFGRDIDLQNNGKYSNQSDVIHTSQGGIGATIGVNNQMFDGPNDEGAYFTFVNNIVDTYLAGVPGGLSSTEADFADNIQYTSLHDTTNAFMGVSQGQGNDVADLTLSAFHLSSALQGDDLLFGSGANQVEITRVIVYNAAGVEIEDTDGSSNDADINVDLAGLTALVENLEAGMKVEWFTASAHNQVLVEAETGKFDMGFFGINEPQTFTDHTLSFEATLKDGDLDVAKDTWSVTVDAAPFI